jgi:hypothetical protein
MTTWKKFAILNAGALVGILASLFIVPASTPLWIWGVSSALAVLLFNYGALKYRPSPDRKKGGMSSTIVIALGFGLLLLELAIRFLTH